MTATALMVAAALAVGVQWADEPIAWASATPAFQPATTTDEPAAGPDSEPGAESEPVLHWQPGLVVVSPSFVCPPCVALKSRLTAAGITYSVRVDDADGPWPKVYAGQFELTPNVVTAIAGTVAKVKAKTKVKMRAGAYVAPMAVEHVETDESHSMGHSSHSMTMHAHASHGQRRGPIRGLFRAVFGGRHRSKAKMRSVSHHSASASMHAGGG